MIVMFVISVLCLCAVLWSAVSIARHVLARQQRRRLRPRQAAQQPLVEVFFDDKMAQIREHAAMTRQASSQSLPAQPLWNAPAPSYASVPSQAATLFDALLPRKTPQPVPATAAYRADWDYFNKDLGDLTDPYETNPRGRSDVRSGTQRY